MAKFCLQKDAEEACQGDGDDEQRHRHWLDPQIGVDFAWDLISKLQQEIGIMVIDGMNGSGDWGNESEHDAQ